MTDTKGPRADAARGEPVAWGYLFEGRVVVPAGYGRRDLVEELASPYGLPVVPLYASPLPAPAPAGWRRPHCHTCCCYGAPQTAAAPSAPDPHQSCCRECGSEVGWEHARSCSRWDETTRPNVQPSDCTDSVSSGTALGRAGASQCQSEVAERLQERLEIVNKQKLAGCWDGDVYTERNHYYELARDAIRALRGAAAQEGGE